MRSPNTEQFFQTRRVQVVVRHGLHGGSRWQCYAPVIRDVIAHPERVEEIWYFEGYEINLAGAWEILDTPDPRHSDSWSYGHDRGWLNSQDRAVKVARREAESRQLPFLVSRDFVALEEITKGPQQLCVGCGKDAGSAFAAKLCEECTAAVVSGRETLSGRELWFLETHDLVSYRVPNALEMSMALGECFATLVGSTLEVAKANDRFSGKGKGVLTNSDRGENWRYKIYLTVKQADALKVILKMLEQTIEAIWAQGRVKGESLLLGLAEGAMSVEEYDKVTVKKIVGTQKRVEDKDKDEDEEDSDE